MDFPTPPPPGRKEKSFMKPLHGLTYYEDLYGEVNEDEAFERFPDECEEESSSSEESESPEAGLFLAESHQPKNKKSEIEIQRGIIGRSQHRRTKGSHAMSPTYQIVPSQNKKHSLQAGQVRDKMKLSPKKGGLFASSFPNMNMRNRSPSTPKDNTAGEAMDDLLRAGAAGTLDLDDGFALLDESYPDMPPTYRYASPRIDPALLLEDAARNDSASSDNETGAAKLDAATAGIGAGEEGGVEDNVSDTPATEASRGRGRSKAATSSNAIARKPVAAVANTKTKILKSVAVATRTSTRIAETQPARKTKGKAKAAVLQARSQRLTTARTATLRSKQARKIDVNSLRGSAGGRAVRLRNWRGEVIDEGKGFVVVELDETDGEA